MSTLPLAEIRQFLRSHTDLDIDGVRDDQLERRLAHYLRRSGIDEGDLIARLRADDELLESFLDSLTINVTALFRNADRWDEIDDLIEQMSDRPRIWSAGCSTGAEPFTIGILCHRLAKRPEIIATDIDTRVLGRAVEGLYTEPEMKEVPPDVASKYFTERDGMWSVGRDIASMVRFRRHNLLADDPLPGPFDLVVCRNVTIYFSAEAKRTLHGKLTSVVRPGGYLFIGSAERVEGPRDIGLSMVAPFIYERSAEVAARLGGEPDA